MFIGQAYLKADFIKPLADACKVDIATMQAIHDAINAIPIQWKKKKKK